MLVGILMFGDEELKRTYCERDARHRLPHSPFRNNVR